LNSNSTRGKFNDRSGKQGQLLRLLLDAVDEEYDQEDYDEDEYEEDERRDSRHRKEVGTMELPSEARTLAARLVTAATRLTVTTTTMAPEVATNSSKVAAAIPVAARRGASIPGERLGIPSGMRLMPPSWHPFANRLLWPAAPAGGGQQVDQRQQQPYYVLNRAGFPGTYFGSRVVHSFAPTASPMVVAPQQFISPKNAQQQFKIHKFPQRQRQAQTYQELQLHQQQRQQQLQVAQPAQLQPMLLVAAPSHASKGNFHDYSN